MLLPFLFFTHENAIFFSVPFRDISIWIFLIGYMCLNGGIQTKRALPAVLFVGWVYLNVYDHHNLSAMHQSISVAVFTMFTLHCCSREWDDSRQKYLLNSFAIMSILTVVWVWANYAGFEPYTELFKWINNTNDFTLRAGDGTTKPPPGGFNVYGPLGQTTLTGALLACSLPAFFRKKWFWLLPVVFSGIYMCHSAMTTIASIAAVGAFLLLSFQNRLKWNLWVYIALLLLPVGVIAYFNGGHGAFFDDQLRFSAWSAALGDMDFVDVLFGKGTGWTHNNFREVFNVKPAWNKLHSDYLQAFYEWGLVGIILLAIMAWPVIIRRNGDARFGAVIAAFAVNAVGNFPAHLSPIMLIVSISIAVYIKEDENGPNNRKRRRFPSRP